MSKEDPFTTFRESMDLNEEHPDNQKTAIGILLGKVAIGGENASYLSINRIMNDILSRVVESPNFAELWSFAISELEKDKRYTEDSRNPNAFKDALMEALCEAARSPDFREKVPVIVDTLFNSGKFPPDIINGDVVIEAARNEKHDQALPFIFEIMRQSRMMMTPEIIDGCIAGLKGREDITPKELRNILLAALAPSPEMSGDAGKAFDPEKAVG